MERTSRNRRVLSGKPSSRGVNRTPDAWFDKKLARYALAGGALLAAPLAAKADIIYSGALDEVASDGGSISVSMDSSATIDFTLNTYLWNYGGYGSFGGESYTEPNTGTTLESAPLASGASVGSGNTFGGAFTLFEDYGYYSEYSYEYSSSGCGYKGEYPCYATGYSGPYYNTYGSWPDSGTPYYLGVSFTRGGQTYYGWAEVATYVTTGSAEVVLYGYAFNDVAGASILAGEMTNPVPEPKPTMALLALGAVGVMALRRRRNAARKPA